MPPTRGISPAVISACMTDPNLSACRPLADRVRPTRLEAVWPARVQVEDVP